MRGVPKGDIRFSGEVGHVHGSPFSDLSPYPVMDGPLRLLLTGFLRLIGISREHYHPGCDTSHSH